MNRRISVNTTGFAVPQSFITKSKQRLKQHNDTVYLNNGDEFEIELFNPTQNKVLAQIELNGKSIGSGVILRPGERIFLERYLDEAKKFLFETYVVNGNNEEVKKAIANNGDVYVKFYNEDIFPTRTLYGSGNTLTINNPNWNVNNTTPYTYTTHNTFSGTSIPTYGTFTRNNTSDPAFSLTSTNAFYSNSNSTYTSGIDTNSILRNSIDKSSYNEPTSMRSLETGRVEKGSKSDQSFTYDYSSFSSFPSTTNSWKILPQSTKPLVREDLVTFCTECGAKRKKDTHKFCPHCGTKF